MIQVSDRISVSDGFIIDKNERRIISTSSKIITKLGQASKKNLSACDLKDIHSTFSTTNVSFYDLSELIPHITMTEVFIKKSRDGRYQTKSRKFSGSSKHQATIIKLAGNKNYYLIHRKKSDSSMAYDIMGSSKDIQFVKSNTALKSYLGDPVVSQNDKHLLIQLQSHDIKEEASELFIFGYQKTQTNPPIIIASSFGLGFENFYKILDPNTVHAYAAVFQHIYPIFKYMAQFEYTEDDPTSTLDPKKQLNDAQDVETRFEVLAKFIFSLIETEAYHSLLNKLVVLMITKKTSDISDTTIKRFESNETILRRLDVLKHIIRFAYVNRDVESTIKYIGNFPIQGSNFIWLTVLYTLLVKEKGTKRVFDCILLDSTTVVVDGITITQQQLSEGHKKLCTDFFAEAGRMQEFVTGDTNIDRIFDSFVKLSKENKISHSFLNLVGEEIPDDLRFGLKENLPNHILKSIKETFIFLSSLLLNLFFLEAGSFRFPEVQVSKFAAEDICLNWDIVEQTIFLVANYSKKRVRSAKMRYLSQTTTKLTIWLLLLRPVFIEILKLYPETDELDEKGLPLPDSNIFADISVDDENGEIIEIAASNLLSTCIFTTGTNFITKQSFNNIFQNIFPFGIRVGRQAFICFMNNPENAAMARLIDAVNIAADHSNTTGNNVYGQRIMGPEGRRALNEVSSFDVQKSLSKKWLDFIGTPIAIQNNQPEAEERQKYISSTELLASGKQLYGASFEFRSAQQAMYTLDIANTNKQAVFLTASCGFGKTTIVNLVHNINKHGCVNFVLAPYVMLVGYLNKRFKKSITWNRLMEDPINNIHGVLNIVGSFELLKNQKFRTLIETGFIFNKKLNHLFVDEADLLIREDGFRSFQRSLYNLGDKFNKCLFVSATFEPQIITKLEKIMNFSSSMKLESISENPLEKKVLLKVELEDWAHCQRLIFGVSKTFQETILIFCEYKNQVHEIYGDLVQKGLDKLVSVAKITGDDNSEKKIQLAESLADNDFPQIVVCSTILSVGVDIPRLNKIIICGNFEPHTYIQICGRLRAGGSIIHCIDKHIREGMVDYHSCITRQVNDFYRTQNKGCLNCCNIEDDRLMEVCNSASFTDDRLMEVCHSASFTDDPDHFNDDLGNDLVETHSDLETALPRDNQIEKTFKSDIDIFKEIVQAGSFSNSVVGITDLPFIVFDQKNLPVLILATFEYFTDYAICHKCRLSKDVYHFDGSVH
ncbi:Y' element ATP-dependent helicase [Saccharomycopsis crataegensis]|uniref:ATP-dependent RNA helicase n=1 Tax=Saccharomycopsis crataegensis TaxID=43959 RepID=A0AAV5QFN8_9ASCO|nr:Y' element ATP-dependent helicase [Saccharomycopsis crataegensis]